MSIIHDEYDQLTGLRTRIANEDGEMRVNYSQDIAATKIRQVMALAKEHQHPLQCLMEKNT